ncbi:hypothetical protein F6X40_23850 [Paraburkholderia sp. UCT31]|uniref:hypothetical protein n=1 Tax=Paraburkholderia sp. UCT31 TaxID=2615209 RepID=UPI001654E40A|nr:hypothetical protein [Paraburkholderia sp. UCT31]MBC8739751.1 hypothetical protein [Paraburkholderia sp. UCT31]
MTWNEALDIDKTGFELGWDFYALGITPNMAAPSSVEKGFNAAKERMVTVTRPSRYERKWLQLRLNALLRERLVHPEVTPDYLESIDVSICPISLVELTRSTGLPTDWSVDRVLNDGAYAPGNLAVISTRINKVKGALTYEDVVRRRDEGHPALPPEQWNRIVSLMSGPYDIVKGDPDNVLPLLVHAPGVTRSRVQHISESFICAGLEPNSRARTALQSFCRETGTLPLCKELLRLIGKRAPSLVIPMLVWETPGMLDLWRRFWQQYLQAPHSPAAQAVEAAHAEYHQEQYFNFMQASAVNTRGCFATDEPEEETPAGAAEPEADAAAPGSDGTPAAESCAPQHGDSFELALEEGSAVQLF